MAIKLCPDGNCMEAREGCFFCPGGIFGAVQCFDGGCLVRNLGNIVKTRTPFFGTIWSTTDRQKVRKNAFSPDALFLHFPWDLSIQKSPKNTFLPRGPTPNVLVMRWKSSQPTTQPCIPSFAGLDFLKCNYIATSFPVTGNV